MCGCVCGGYLRTVVLLREEEARWNQGSEQMCVSSPFVSAIGYVILLLPSLILSLAPSLPISTPLPPLSPPRPRYQVEWETKLVALGSAKDKASAKAAAGEDLKEKLNGE